MKLNHSGNPGMYVRAAFGPGFPNAFELQVEDTVPGPQKTGSLYGFSKVLKQRAAPEFDDAALQALMRLAA